MKLKFNSSYALRGYASALKGVLASEKKKKKKTRCKAPSEFGNWIMKSISRYETEALFQSTIIGGQYTNIENLVVAFFVSLQFHFGYKRLPLFSHQS
jgi:hypothetical protein